MAEVGMDIELMPNEGAHQRAAFELYYAMGGDRNLDKVAEHIGKSARTVYEWSRRFNWQERVIQYDIEVSRKLKERTINTVVDEKANYRKIIKLAVADFVKGLKDGEVKVRNISDLEKLIKLDLTLMGEANEIHKNENTNGLTDEDRKMVMDLAKGFKNDLEDDNDFGVIDTETGEEGK